MGLSWFMKMAIYFLSYKVRSLAKKLNIDYSFLFMKANGKQLAEITTLIETGIIRPVIDKIFPFDQTNDALAYVESGRAKGKVVIKIK
jgi:alcohol dehydrogenase